MRAFARQNRGQGTSTEWRQTASNLLISAGLGGLCCHSGVFDCSGFGVVVSDLSLAFCARGADGVQMEPMVVRC